MKEEIYFYRNLDKPIKAKVIYDKEDKFIYSTPDYIVNSTIMTGAVYLGMDINIKNMLLLSLSGYCPKDLWNISVLEYPQNLIDGEIKIKTNKELIEGGGIDLAEETPIYFCEENNWVCIGDKNINNYDCSIRFMENAIMSLKNNKFKALWINPIYR